jgi:hypothetical protein
MCFMEYTGLVSYSLVTIVFSSNFLNTCIYISRVFAFDIFINCTDSHLLLYEQWNFSKPASNGTKKYGRYRGVAGFVRLLLQRIVKQGLKKSADFQGGPVFWGFGLEKFHCISSNKGWELRQTHWGNITISLMNRHNGKNCSILCWHAELQIVLVFSKLTI